MLQWDLQPLNTSKLSLLIYAAFYQTSGRSPPPPGSVTAPGAEKTDIFSLGMPSPLFLRDVELLFLCSYMCGLHVTYKSQLTKGNLQESVYISPQ